MKKKPSLGRQDSLRRSDHTVHYKEEEHTWAVSYADFLMVLLSFFVIFFSQDQNKNEIIFKISEEINSSKENLTTNASQNSIMASKEKIRESVVASKSRKPGSLENGFDNLNQQLKNEFNDYKFFVDAATQSLFIELPDNIYSPGEFVLKNSQSTLFENLLLKLSKYKNEVIITIIGHSDQTQVRKDLVRKYEDNIELSSLRASNAARKALLSGFSENQIRIKTLLSENRNTRSLTLSLSTM